MVIVQQDNFLQNILRTYLENRNLDVVYTMGHHRKVANAVKNGQVDLVIAHAKVKQLQKLESSGRLLTGKYLFANPTAFLGPKGDPAGISGLADPVEAISKIAGSGHCFVINGHERIAKLQEELLQQANLTTACVLKDDQYEKLSAMDIAYEKHAYTMWGLHPYAAKAEDRLEPVVIPDVRLRQAMKGWVVKGSAVEKPAEEILEYLTSDAAREKMKQFRLNKYKNIQAWWPVENK